MTTEEKVNDYFYLNNHALLSNKSVDKQYRYLFRCNKHNLEFKISKNHYAEGRKGCPKCRTKPTKEMIYQRCVNKCKKDNVILLKYKPRLKDKLKLQCHCGSVWEPTHDNYIRRVNQCPDCSNKNLKGLYSQDYFEKHPKEKLKDAYIYFIYLEEHDVYKIGITIDLNNRLRKLPKNKIIKLINTNLYNAFAVEQEVLNKYKLEISNYFQGHTECISDNVEEIILFAHNKLRELSGTLLETTLSQADE